MITTTRRMGRENGFTLIELMIVMVVLGILAGLILFAVGPFKDAATTARTKANTDSCATAKVAADATEDTLDTAHNFAAGCTDAGIPATPAP
jgi:general secretion pathway protein G